MRGMCLLVIYKQGLDPNRTTPLYTRKVYV